jgi:hypothetical protein
MSSVVPFYVREFNAASISEAIQAADQALRKDGVTVAVWRNFSDQITPELRRHWVDIIQQHNYENARTSRRHCVHYFDDGDSADFEKDLPFCDHRAKSNFRIKGFLQKSFSLVKINIHQDEMESAMCKDDASKPCYGNPFRSIYNLEGRPTHFYENEKQLNPYPLPKGAMAFVNYKKEEDEVCNKAAWHSGVDNDIPRAFLVISLQYVW